MRLIDADALHVDYIVPTTTTGTACWGYVSMQQINSAPTIEAVLERKAKWIHYEGDFDYDYKCSNCGCAVWDNSDFCPNCGASMTEGAENE